MEKDALVQRFFFFFFFFLSVGIRTVDPVTPWLQLLRLVRPSCKNIKLSQYFSLCDMFVVVYLTWSINLLDVGVFLDSMMKTTVVFSMQRINVSYPPLMDKKLLSFLGSLSLFPLHDYLQVKHDDYEKKLA